MIDWEKYNDNFQYYGKAVELQLILLFESEYAERMERIRESVKERNLDQVKFQAHSLKGTIANYMDPEPVECCRALELMAKSGETEGLDDLYERLVLSAEALL